MNNVLVLALRGGSYTAPMHAATISGDGRWVRIPSAALSAINGEPTPEEATVAMSVSGYGRSWALIAQGAVVPDGETAVAAIRSAQPAMELAQRLLAGLQPAQVPAPEPAADADLDDDD